METGALIDYTIRLGPVPLAWRTEIVLWDPPHRFVDVQLRGPYAKWEHWHAFEVHAGGVLMTDIVHYALPLGALGRIAHGLLVGALLGRIFDFRYERIQSVFGLRPLEAVAPSNASAHENLGATSSRKSP